MRTHSAPPDEHAGIFELGGNGVRANTTSQVLPLRGIPEGPLSSFPRSDHSQSTDNQGSPKPNASSDHGAQIPSFIEKQSDGKPPEASSADRSIPLGPPLQMTQSSVPQDSQRGYSQQFSPNFSTQSRMGQPRPPEIGDRNKIAHVMPMSHSPRIAAPPMPYYGPLIMPGHQMGAIPMQPFPMFYQRFDPLCLQLTDF